MSHNNLSTTNINKLNQWLGNSGLTWEKSQLTDGFYHSMIAIDDKITLSVEVAGNPDNPPLVLIMGLGSQMIFWTDDFLYRLLDAGFFVVRFDNRDIGLSSKITPKDNANLNQLKMMVRMQLGLSNQAEPVAYTLVNMAEDTIKLIRKLKLTKVNLMGASMGGMIAQITASLYPEEISKLILLFTTTNRPFLPPPKPKQLLALFKAPKSNSKEDSIAHAQWFIETVGSQGFINKQRVHDIAKLRYERCFYPRGTVQQLHAILATGSLAKFSKNIKIPTLIMHGASDGLVPKSNGQDIKKLIPHAKFHLIEGMGHDIPNYYQPYMVNLIKEHCCQ